jgi:hypothetical protein
MGLGTGTIKLSEIISEFGVGGTIPNNLRSYLAAGAYVGWDGGVAQHENNINIPTSGTIKISDFRSNTTHVVDKDFESDTYSGVTSDYLDFMIPEYESVSGLWTSTGSAALGFTYVNLSGGTIGNVDYVGKSTFNTGLTATLDSIVDYAPVNGSSSTPTNAALVLAGDQRATGWGNPFISVSVIIGATTTTLTRAASVVPNGTYDAINDVTIWTWNSTFGFTYSYTPYNFNCRVTII